MRETSSSSTEAEENALSNFELSTYAKSTRMVTYIFNNRLKKNWYWFILKLFSLVWHYIKDLEYSKTNNYIFQNGEALQLQGS